MNNVLKNEIDNSNMVLVGVGEELEAGMKILEHTMIYQSFLEKINQEGFPEEIFDWMYPAMIEYALATHDPACETLLKAYQNLGELLKDKNYFIVNMNMDSAISAAGLKPERITAPFGSYLRLQCSNGCEEIIVDAEGINQKIVNGIMSKDIALGSMIEERCTVCNEKMTYNTVNATRYIEAGYLDSWKAYQQWLIGVVNRKLCILELGVGLNFPGIIRFPFEKIGYYNQKASYYRVNEKIPQLTPELSDRGVSVHENAISFLTEC